MDLQSLIADQAPQLLESLKGAGLDDQQAGDFLPALGDQLGGGGGGGIGDLLGGGGVQALLGGDGGLEGLLENIDITAMAEKVGIDPGIARTALESVLPKIMEAIKGGGGGGLLGGLGSKLLG